MSFSSSLILKQNIHPKHPQSINHMLYKTHKSITFDLKIKIVIVVVTQYKMHAHHSLVVANSYRLELDETIMLELGKCRLKIEEK